MPLPLSQPFQKEENSLSLIRSLHNKITSTIFHAAEDKNQL